MKKVIVIAIIAVLLIGTATAGRPFPSIDRPCVPTWDWKAVWDAHFGKSETNNGGGWTGYRPHVRREFTLL